ncbi:MAG: trypsin-like peptidase domain-containing protein [bacterium]
MIRAGLAAGMLLAAFLLPIEAAGLEPPADALDRAHQELRESRRTAAVRAAEVAGPSVVTVSVLRTQIVEGPAFPQQQEFFNPFYRNLRRRYWQRVRSIGSGVIADAQGRVLTNVHVVQGAEVIRVTIPDGREFDATLVGTAKLYDVAVLQLQLNGEKVPYARFGDDQDLMIGEWVMAIGNPFGYLLDDPHPTVTAGVVSALHRDILSEREDTDTLYKNMIQTDAAINPGNSGGALVNALGEVVGINTFIFSKSGGSHGIGFAIPVSTAQRVMQEIEAHGGVREVWIGVRIQEIPDVLAESMELESNEGVIVASVDDGSPADRAGIRRGDVIRRIAGDRIRNFDDARRALYGVLVGDELEFQVERNGKLSQHVLAVVERR